MSRDDALTAVRSHDDRAFARAVAAAALHSSADDLEDLFADAARHLDGPDRAVLLCGAISTAAQARGVVPSVVHRVRSDLPWRDHASVVDARRDALEIVALVERATE